MQYFFAAFWGDMVLIEKAIPVPFLAIAKRSAVGGFKVRKPEHIGHEPFLIVIMARHGKDVLPVGFQAPQYQMTVFLKTVQDKAVSGNAPSVLTKHGQIF